MIEHLDEISIEDALAKESYIMDTCFILYELEEGREKKLEEFCKTHLVIMSSFNLEELGKVEKRVHNIKVAVRKFLQKNLIKKLNLDVHIGEYDREKEFSGDSLVKEIQDPSDAVMVKAAILTKSDILTRDKKHVFNAHVEDVLAKEGISVLNKLQG